MIIEFKDDDGTVFMQLVIPATQKPVPVAPQPTEKPASSTYASAPVPMQPRDPTQPEAGPTWAWNPLAGSRRTLDPVSCPNDLLFTSERQCQERGAHLHYADGSVGVDTQSVLKYTD